MSKITIFREITLSQIVTEEFKEATRQKLRQELFILDQEQMKFEEEKNKTLTEFSLKGANVSQINQMRQHFETEASKFHVRRDEIRASMISVDELKLGEKVVIGSIEGPCDLRVGDKLDAAINAEIVLKDGIIVEIRQ